MAQTGGAAAAVGFRYEKHWTVLALLDVLDGKAEFVMPQPPDQAAIGADFLVLEDGVEVWHQVKSGSRPWTIQRLARERILDAFQASVRNGGRFVLDLRGDARPLADLADAAHAAESWEGFERDHLDSGRLGDDFGRLVSIWHGNTTDAYDALKRITVNHVDDAAVVAQIEARLANLVSGQPNIAMMVLERLVDESPGLQLSEHGIWRYLAAHRISRKSPTTTPTVVVPRRRALAGVRSDSPSEEDLLGVRGDVETLAELIAALETQPPLAIALIGDWGTGKSSMLLQIEHEVDALAELSRDNLGLSAFAANIRQVRFNAWHYSDNHVWTGLVSHLFKGLLRPDVAETQQDESTDQSARAEITLVRSTLKDREKQLADRRKNADELTAELKDVDETAQPEGVLQWLRSPSYARKVLCAAGRQVVNDVKTWFPAIVFWAILGGGVCVAWPFIGTWIRLAVTTIAVLATPVVALFRKLRTAHDKVLAFVDQRRTELQTSQQQAQRDIGNAEQEVRELKDRLVLIDAAEGLARFLDEQAEGVAYMEYQGLLGQVRSDLDRLSARLADAKQQWERGGRLGPPPLERIVLYIDDLDRCPPRRVVEVLEAVHLMLALDLFVVVVAVDARWLIRSLEHHHRDLFDTDKPAAVDAGKGGDWTHLATPVDYLDKIFQIPYVLVPPSREVAGRYLQVLLPAPGSSGKTEEYRPDNLSDPADIGPDDIPEGSSEAHVDIDNYEYPVLNSANSPAEDEPNVEMGGSTGLVGLRPPGLEISQSEVDFLAQLGGLVSTPRAAKRMVNIYRLTRIGVPDEGLAAFIGDEKGGDYQIVQVLIAVLAGSPAVAEEVFRALLEAQPADNILSVLQEMRPKAELQEPINRIRTEISALAKDTGLSLTAADYQRWCRTLARYSFRTRELAGLIGRIPVMTDQRLTR